MKMSADSSCVINVDERVRESGPSGSSSSAEEDRWKRQCIYELPEQVKKPDPKPYRPQVVSIGPLHYGAEYLVPGQYKGKEGALRYFFERSKTPLDVYRNILHGRLLEYLTSPYGEKVGKDDTIEFPADMSVSKFVELMIEDGCFLLEIMRVGTYDDSSNGIYDPEDLIFGGRGETFQVPLIKRDMLLLENQVPFWLLQLLLAGVDVKLEANHDFHVGEQTTEATEAILDLIIRFFSLPPFEIDPPYLHILDVYRKCLTSQGFRRDKRGIKHHEYYRQYLTSLGFRLDEIRIKHPGYRKYLTCHGHRRDKRGIEHKDGIHFPSASKLYEAGIPFKPSFRWNLTDITFRRGTLRFPPIVITNETISTLANLMAFEKLHVGAGSEVTSYVFFLNWLIHNAKDVSLLESRGIIQNNLRDDEDVVKLFGFLCKDVVPPSDYTLVEIYGDMSQKLQNRFRKRLNTWRIDLLQRYFSTPWGVLSVVAAIILFTLTTIQTVFTVLSYTQPNPK